MNVIIKLNNIIITIAVYMHREKINIDTRIATFI